MANDCYDVVVEKDVMVVMRDGVRLATDLYFPARAGQRVPGKFPAVFHRTPYDKSDVERNGSYRPVFRPARVRGRLSGLPGDIPVRGRCELPLARSRGRVRRLAVD